MWEKGFYKSYTGRGFHVYADGGLVPDKLVCGWSWEL